MHSTATIPCGSAAHVCAAKPGLWWFLQCLNNPINSLAHVLLICICSREDCEDIWESKEAHFRNIIIKYEFVHHFDKCPHLLRGLRCQAKACISGCLPRGQKALCPHCGTSPKRRLALCMATMSLEGKKGDGAWVHELQRMQIQDDIARKKRHVRMQTY